MKTGQNHPLMKADIPGAGFEEDALVCPGIMDGYRLKNVKIIPEKCLVRCCVDRVQSTSVSKSGGVPSLAGACSRGFAVRNNPHRIILAAKDWMSGDAVFSE
jgi:hypothetical protein